MISFEVEELDKLKEKMEELNDGLDPSHKGDEDGGERPEEEEDYKPQNELPPTNDPDNGNGRSGKQVDNPNNNSGKKTDSVRKALLLLDEKRGDILGAADPIPSCTSLLRAMELTDSDEESDLLVSGEGEEDNEFSTLPKEWLCPILDLLVQQWKRMLKTAKALWNRGISFSALRWRQWERRKKWKRRNVVQ